MDSPTSPTPSSPAGVDPAVKIIISKIKLGKDKEVKEIIASNPSIIKTATDTSTNTTLLHLAALNGHKRIVKELLRHTEYFDPYAKNIKGLTAVDLARDFNYNDLSDYIKSKLPGIEESHPKAGAGQSLMERRMDQLDDVSEDLIRIQNERRELEAEIVAARSEDSKVDHQEDPAVIQKMISEKEERERIEKELRQRIELLELEAKAEQERRDREYEAKLKELEAVAIQKEEERARIEQEKAQLEKEKEEFEHRMQTRQRGLQDHAEEVKQGKEEAESNLMEKDRMLESKQEELSREIAKKNEILAELAQLKSLIAQTKKAAEDHEKTSPEDSRDEEGSKKPHIDVKSEKDRLISEFENRRKELEQQQKQEQERQERLLNELLDMKRKKKNAKLNRNTSSPEGDEQEGAD
mmetsp:Transcript_10437/g.34833  ORF Transcript_10437/g.34833 Transcript_10437/m.34833 type:complete len:410 (-) Transcript_10437:2207-3436(-)